MNVFAFNPEHDEALASGLANYTPTRAALAIRRRFAFIPSLWAEDGDAVLAEDGLSKDIGPADDALAVRVWGWDKAVRRRLERCGVPLSVMPSDAQLDAIRRMSHRGWAAERLLPLVVAMPETVGEAYAVGSMDDARAFLRERRRMVMKAPWSCSGRGVRMIDADGGSTQGDGMSTSVSRWAERVIEKQGCVMVEPLYDKRADFAMEFLSDGRGGASFCGLSVFAADGGAYQGNTVAGEAEKRALLYKYGVSPQTLDTARDAIAGVMGEALRDVYAGPFGVDMMAVNEHGRTFVHPCVELNLRCTMGHVALRLSALGRQWPHSSSGTMSL